MSTASSRYALPVGAGAVVLVALVASLAAPSTTTATPDVVPVVSTDLVCPDATSGSGASTQVSAVTPSNIANGPGSAVVGKPADPASIGTLTGVTHALSRPAPSRSGPVVGRAVEGRAPGFAMDQLTTSTRRSDHGLAGASCDEPTNDAWFVGSVSSVGHSSRLYLTDPEPTAATVDVAIYDADGPVNAPSVQGINVPGFGRRVVSLDGAAPSAGSIAVHVTASAGRVGAAVRDTQVNGLVPQGADWLPVAAPPSTTAVVPGLASGRGTRKLTVFAPGEGTATVHVTLVGQQDSFTPTGGASVEVDRGKVTTLDLGPAAASDQTAVSVTSDVPVVAGVRWTVTGQRTSDLAFSAGADALTGQAVLAGARADGGYGSALMLSAPGAAAKVSVQLLVDGVPRGAARIVPIASARTVRTPLGRGVKGWFQVVVTPVAGSGPVYGAVVRTLSIDHAAGTTVSTLHDARVTVAVPQARPDLDVGLGG